MPDIAHPRWISIAEKPPASGSISSRISALVSDNGGLIADLGEGGLGFQTIAAIEREGPITFWFSLDAADRIQATGELAWTDESRKVGGLKFTKISQESIDQIRAWMGTTGSAGSGPAACTSAPGAARSSALLASSAKSCDRALLSPVRRFRKNLRPCAAPPYARADASAAAASRTAARHGHHAPVVLSGSHRAAQGYRFA